MRRSVLFLAAVVWSGACARRTVEPPAREDPDPDGVEPWLCEAGQERCAGSVHQSCVPDGEFLRVEEEDCADLGLVCVQDLWCKACRPDARRCDDAGVSVLGCSSDGEDWTTLEECDVDGGDVCWDGACRDSCEVAAERTSNVGCEYWAVDLDNASVRFGLDASMQQFGVVVSNVGGSAAHVVLEIDLAPPGQPPELEVVDETTIFPGDLEVFDDLPRREVDGTPADAAEWWCDAPTPERPCSTAHSHLSAAAFRITSDRPVIAYQYQPLDNAGVFSNDASLLLPTTALDGRYVVMGWPQNVADTDDPMTDRNDDLRAFLTIVGTKPETHVSIALSADTTPGDNLPGYDAGEVVEATLGPFEVLNLETGSFGADFTGTVVDGDAPLVVFSGSEASDVPTFDALPEQQCCADHLEEQLPPRATLGRAFFATPMPPRTTAIFEAGAAVARVEEPEFFRILAVDPGVTTVEVTLDDVGPISLDQYDFVTLEAHGDFSVVSDKPIALGQFVAGQSVVGLPIEAPGGDPAFVHVPPVEQYRDRYVFLTPSLYAFDSIVVVSPRGARVWLDGAPLPDDCTVSTADGQLHPADAPPDFVVHRCPLSRPIVEPPANGVGDWSVLPGQQGDGVHLLEADQPVGLLVYGFDAYVSYALAGGTELRPLQ